MKKAFTLLIGIIVCTGLGAQDPFESEFNSFFEQSVQEFSDFRDRINAEYAAFLLTSWEEFNAAMPVKKPFEKPVPPVSFDAGRDVRKANKAIPFDETIQTGAVFESPVPDDFIRPRTAKQARSIEFTSFGLPLSVNVPANKEFRLASNDAKELSKAWKMLSAKEYDVILADCLAIKKKEGLCDWAYLNMLNDFAIRLFGEGDTATFLTAYLFAQSGYRMRLALDSNKLRFLFGTDFIVYNKSFFEIDDQYYFVFGEECQTLQIANVPYPDEISLSFVIDPRQHFGGSLSDERTLVSRRYSVSAESSVNEGQIEFFSTYPSTQLGDNAMTRWAVYASSPLCETAKAKLYPSLQRMIEGKNEQEATDILLDFVQTAFEYEYDENIWGADRIFFAEETLYYPYCDCEDRSILFSRLVRDLLNLKVALVYYPGHLATAVRLPDGAAGDYFSLEDGLYTVCDPTFIGAPIGNTMPGMDNVEAKIIFLP